MSDYMVASGIVQFDPKIRDVNGQTVRDVVVKAIGSQKLVSITIWPEFADTAINKGDFVTADGKLNVSLGQDKQGNSREYLSVSASALVVVPAAAKAERQVVSKTTSASPAADSEPLF